MASGLEEFNGHTYSSNHKDIFSKSGSNDVLSVIYYMTYWYPVGAKVSSVPDPFVLVVLSLIDSRTSLIASSATWQSLKLTSLCVTSLTPALRCSIAMLVSDLSRPMQLSTIIDGLLPIQSCNAVIAFKIPCIRGDRINYLKGRARTLRSCKPFTKP